MATLTKSNKSPSEFEGQVADYEERLEFYGGGSNKYWHIFVYGRYVVRHYGRHGGRGQWTVHSAYSEWSAKDQAADLYWQKRNKGYTAEASVLDRFAREI